MHDFNQKLTRLKEALAVTKDQDVADALGLSKAALSDRKKRGAFPDDKLWALIAKRPDLGLNYDHITLGFHGSVYQAMAAQAAPEHRSPSDATGCEWQGNARDHRIKIGPTDV
jgi:hypothetical protein